MQFQSTVLRLEYPLFRGLLFAIAPLALVVGCQPPAKKADAPTPPAKVPTVAQEGKVNTVVLTPEAEKRLGITLAPVEKKQVSRVRSYGGEIALPPGASLVISAPVGGRLEPAMVQGIPPVEIGRAHV